MKCYYMCIECRIGYRRTYGIAAVDSEDGEKIILGAIVDVSEDREMVDRLTDKCNREKIDFICFHAVVEQSIDNVSSAFLSAV